jgi:hypothetical protein
MTQRDVETSTHEDKSTWGDGPWQHEPDRVEWRYKDLPCLLHRSPVGGGWCGYVGVPEGHPWFGRPLCELETLDIEVHGGVTYAESCDEPICHVPREGEGEVWWIGYDCGHGFDVQPKLDALLKMIRTDRKNQLSPLEAYRDQDYAMRETEQLAEQALAAAAAAQPSLEETLAELRANVASFSDEALARLEPAARKLVLETRASLKQYDRAREGRDE